MSTKLTLETKYGRVTVESVRDDMNLVDFIEFIVEPLLLGAGYHPDSVKEVLHDEAERSA